MRQPSALLLAAFAIAQVGSGQSTTSFAGEWMLNSARSEISPSISSPEKALSIEQGNMGLTIKGRSGLVTEYRLDGKEVAREINGSRFASTTKWEGATLLVNTVVSGAENYSISEVWRLSRDGETLTIRRNIVRRSGETESTMIYGHSRGPAVDGDPQVEITRAQPPSSLPDTPSRASAPQPRLRVFGDREPLRGRDLPPAAPASAPEYTVASGTRILLRLTNSVNTKHTRPGDRIYLETATPVYVDGRLVIPVGSYVNGTVTESERAGRVKGKAELNVRFDNLSLRNGVTRDLHSRLGAAGTVGTVDSEGRIKGDGDKGGDARTVATTTGVGAGVGTLAGAASGHAGLGAGIGAAAGAAAGLGRVLTTHGPDVNLPAGTTVEMVLDHDVTYTSAELR